ncbi:unnamed protein product [Nesidiocoris tenuis]|uniref:Kinesin motor domain-containing protein n=1 Tax=Nesidiocoris tenuis TaxID=355587 RepID=A0A6H5G2J1_9HEMI|nr:unnamed protein product [Nesidiocoris tenuis]
MRKIIFSFPSSRQLKIHNLIITNIEVGRQQVAVRVRPLKPDEGEKILHILDVKTIVLDDDSDKRDVLRQKRTSEKQYSFDFAFGEDSSQEQVYDLTTRGLVRDVLLGFNATVFAYGATGAGKTHTMVGTAAEPGIMVRALNDLFTSIAGNEPPHQVEKNELEVNWQVTQYRDMISDLRGEIGRLKSKLDTERPSSADVRARASGTPVKQLREQIIATFREQMKLRRRLMDIDGHLMSLGVEAERQHQIISHWEARKSKLYNRPTSRPNTSAGAENGTESTVHEAWSELSYIEREQERYVALRSSTLRELEECREKAIGLENDLPEQLDSDTEREMLSLLIRVHELEADKVALHGERLVESHELRRRADMLQRFHRQQRLTDEIITRQRHIIEGARRAATTGNCLVCRRPAAATGKEREIAGHLPPLLPCSSLRYIELSRTTKDPGPFFYFEIIPCQSTNFLRQIPFFK